MANIREEIVDFYEDEFLGVAAIARRLKTNVIYVAWHLGAAGVPLRDKSSAAKGRPKSEEHRRRLSESLRKARAAQTDESHKKRSEKMRGREPPNKGKNWSEEIRAKHSYRQTEEYREAHAARQRGELANNWKGGVSEDARQLENWKWRQRRKECYHRDEYKCRDCGVHCTSVPGPERIQAHHVIPRRLGGMDDLDNLVTLCTSCHHKREHRYSGAMIA